MCRETCGRAPSRTKILSVVESACFPKQKADPFSGQLSCLSHFIECYGQVVLCDIPIPFEIPFQGLLTHHTKYPLLHELLHYAGCFLFVNDHLQTNYTKSVVTCTSDFLWITFSRILHRSEISICSRNFKLSHCIFLEFRTAQFRVVGNRVWCAMPY